MVGGGENQIYCIAQVNVFKFMFKSLSSHDSDLTWETIKYNIFSGYTHGKYIKEVNSTCFYLAWGMEDNLRTPKI